MGWGIREYSSGHSQGRTTIGQGGLVVLSACRRAPLPLRLGLGVAAVLAMWVLADWHVSWMIPGICLFEWRFGVLLTLGLHF